MYQQSLMKGIVEDVLNLVLKKTHVYHNIHATCYVCLKVLSAISFYLAHDKVN